MVDLKQQTEKRKEEDLSEDVRRSMVNISRAKHYAAANKQAEEELMARSRPSIINMVK